MSDLVAQWDVALSDGVHKIEFEHGTTSGKRVIYIDGKVSNIMINCTLLLQKKFVVSRYQKFFLLYGTFTNCFD